MRIPRRERGTGLVLLIGCLLACACGDQYEAVRSLKDASVPPGDTAPALDAPVQDGLSLQFAWEFNSHFEPSAYLERVAERFSTRDFTIQRHDASSLEMTRVESGDEYRMHVEVSSGSPTLVRVTLRSSPD